MNIDRGILGRLAAGGQYSLEIGKAAEHIVCADLILSGYRTFLSDQGLPYDVVVDCEGCLVRVQVKSTCFPRNINANGHNARIGYTFNVRARGKGKRGQRLDARHCDIVAMVALDLPAVAYLPIAEVGQTCQLMGPSHEFRGNYRRRHMVAIDSLPFADAVARL